MTFSGGESTALIVSALHCSRLGYRIYILLLVRSQSMSESQSVLRRPTAGKDSRNIMQSSSKPPPSSVSHYSFQQIDSGSDRRITPEMELTRN